MSQKYIDLWPKSAKDNSKHYCLVCGWPVSQAKRGRRREMHRECGQAWRGMNAIKDAVKEAPPKARWAMLKGLASRFFSWRNAEGNVIPKELRNTYSEEGMKTWD